MRKSRTEPTNRADSIRQRRTQRSQDRVERATQQVRYSAVTPPITMRGGMGTPIMQRTRTQVRRKFTIPLGMPGGEMLLPSLPIVHFGWRLLSGFLAILLGFLTIYVCITPQFRMDTPQLKGITRIPASDVENVLDLNNVPIFLFDPQAAIRKLQKTYPELNNIAVKVGLPAKVIISATERKPILAWMYDTQTLWIDETGAIFPARGDLKKKLLTIHSDMLPPLMPDSTQQEADADISSNSDLQVREGTFSTRLLTQKKITIRQIDPSVVSAIKTLNKMFPAGSELIYNSTSGLGWTDPKGWDVYVGPTLDDLDLKLAEYKAIVGQLEKKGIRPQVVNVANVDAPFYRLEK
jgi:hypothetical protein